MSNEPKKTARTMTDEQKYISRLMRRWMFDPRSTVCLEQLTSAMVNYELSYRLKQMKGPKS